MSRSVSPKRNAKPQRPAYVLEDQIGFILRQVWQRHATIFAKEIGINSKRCAMGPGLQSRHNIVLGRALRLIMINIGNCRPGRMDMDTIGSARKFGMCVAENDEQSPWEPFHVEKGFDKDAKWPDFADRTWGSTIYKYYGYDPYWEA